MPERPLDDERIAAFLDGRLSPEERAVVLSQVANDPMWREVLADAARVLSEPTPQRAEVGTGYRWPVRPWAIAAGLVLVVGGGWWVMSVREDPSAPSVFQLAMAEPAPSTGAGFDAAALDRWQQVRAATSDVSPMARSVRLGVLSVTVLDAAARADSATLLVVLGDMRALLMPVSGSAPTLQALYDIMTTARTDSDEATGRAVSHALQGVRALSDADSYDAGALLEVERTRAVLRTINRTRVTQALELLASSRADDARLRDADVVRLVAALQQSPQVATVDALLTRLGQ